MARYALTRGLVICPLCSMPYSDMQRKDVDEIAHTSGCFSVCFSNSFAALLYIAIGIHSNGRPFVQVNWSGILIPATERAIRHDTQGYAQDTPDAAVQRHVCASADTLDSMRIRAILS